MDKLIAKAETLLEALPYIRRFSGKTLVIKYGGHAMENEQLKASFTQDIVLLKYVGMDPVIVHGGGPQIGDLLRQLGIASRFVNGMRVTDRATMDVVEMVLGKLNKELVTLINRQGGRAVGLSGKDGDLMLARKLEFKNQPREQVADVDMGLVGEVQSVNPAVIQSLGDGDFIPVVAPVGVGEEGETYNINADLAAGKLAEALGAEKLILMTDVEGVRDTSGEVRPTVDAAQARQMIAAGAISAGMIPKVECCVAALHGGVRQAHIIDGRAKHAVLLEIFTRAGIGTEVLRAPRRGRRHAGAAPPA